MRFCDMEDDFLGKKLAKMFDESNRNILATTIGDPKFKEWFGNGRKDIDGNPVINNALSFTNEKGEQKAIFDFGNIGFQSRAEVVKLLKSLPSLYQFKNRLLINNTIKDNSDQYLAKAFMQAYNVINHYYPDMLSISRYTRSNKSSYSQTFVPLFEVNIHTVPLAKSNTLFSIHDGGKPNKGTDRFAQLPSVQEMGELNDTINNYKGFGMSPEDIRTLTQAKPVSEELYKKLEDFFLKLNPAAEIKLVKDLSEDGAAFINEFIIELNTENANKAIPEEVSHFFVAMSRGTDLYKEMMSNINSFAIYQATLGQYKAHPDYQNEKGTTDFNKIKEEAVGKLVGEYTRAMEDNDYERVTQMTKSKESFLKRWWNKFKAWLRKIFKTTKKDKMDSYMAAAKDIIEGKIEILDAQTIAKENHGEVFFAMSDRDKVDRAMIETILKDVTKAGNLGKVQDLIGKFTREMYNVIKKITGEKGFERLNEQLRKDKDLEEGEIGDNKLQLLAEMLKGIDIDNILEADNQILHFSNFIRVIQNMESMAEVYDQVLDTYTANGDLPNLAEIQSFKVAYSNLKSLINNDLTTILSDSEVGSEIITSLKKSTVGFDTVEQKILKKVKDSWEIILKNHLRPQNEYIIADMAGLLKEAILYIVPGKGSIITDAVNDYKNNLLKGMGKLEAEQQLISILKKNGISENIIKHGPIGDIFKEVNKLFTTDKMVKDFLDGMGKDIDVMSHGSHMLTAAYKNYDPLISNIAFMIVKAKNDSNPMIRAAMVGYMGQVDPVIQQLAGMGIDEYQSGEAITYIDKIYDASQKDDGRDEYKDKVRDVVSFLKPTSDQFHIDKKILEVKKRETYKILRNSDLNTDEGKAAKKEYEVARTALIDHVNKYQNSEFTKEYRDFRKAWYNNTNFLEIKQEWSILMMEMKDAMEAYESDKTDIRSWMDFLISQRKVSDLLNPEEKTPDQIAKIDLFKKYTEDSAKYVTEDTERTKKNFTQARNHYEARVQFAINTFLGSDDDSLANLEKTLQEVLKDNTISIKYPYQFHASFEDNMSDDSVSSNEEIALVKKILLDDFNIRNIVKVKTDLYYELQNKLYDEIEQLKKDKNISPIDEVMADLYKEVNTLLQGKNDYYGQRNSETLTTVELERVIELEDRLSDIKEFNMKTYQITSGMRHENKDYLELFDKYEALISEMHDMLVGKSPLVKDRLEKIKKDIYQFNTLFQEDRIIPKEQLDAEERIKEIYATLAEFAEKKPTQAYWDRMEELIPIIENLLQTKQQARDLAPKTTSQADLIKMQNEIDNLSLLLTGRSSNKSKRSSSGFEGGLMSAIYENNHELLDSIINDEYYIGNKPVEFGKYLEPDSQDTNIIGNANSDFYDWFLDNHKEGEVYVKSIDPIDGTFLNTGKKQERAYVRRLFAVYSDPAVQEVGGKVLYNIKYHKRYRAKKVHDDYKQAPITWMDSSDMEDWTHDNVGNPLPMSRKQLLAEGNSDHKYVNKNYHELYDANDPKSIALKTLHSVSTKTYLVEQENKPEGLRAFLKIPVTNLDHFQQDVAMVKDLPDRVKRMGQKIKGVFVKSADTDAEDMLNQVDQLRDYDDRTQQVLKKGIPKLGMNVKLPVERVNRNVLNFMELYIKKSKEFDVRNDLAPLISSLLDVMYSNEGEERLNQHDRLDLLSKIHSQMILQEIPDNITNKRFFLKTLGIIQGFAGMRLMISATGGAVNYLQANVQNLIEAFAYTKATPKSYAIGYKEATWIAADLLRDFTKKSDFSLGTIFFQTFDFVQGDFGEDMIHRTSKKGKIFDWRAWGMYPRTSGEVHAQTAMGMSILANAKITNSIDGKVYNMIEIYRKKNDLLALKEGFDPVLYNPINGTVFLKVRGLIHDTNLELHGNYAEINQTEASRHGIGKMVEFMKRWFIPAIQRRVGRESFDIASHEINEGYYRTGVMAIFNIIKGFSRAGSKGAGSYFNYYWTSPRKRANIQRFAADIITMIGLFLLSRLMGFNSNDPDKYKKLRDNSWLYNEALLVFLRTYAEQTAYIPIPPFGFTELSRNLMDPFSVLKSTLGNMAGSVSLITYMMLYYLGGQDQFYNDIFYTKDSGQGKGPTIFDWMTSKKGDWKLKSYFLKTFGYNAEQNDPSFYVKNFSSLQNKLK